MLDYKKLNLKIGLEIHRMMHTHKLFCNCPSELKEGKPDLTIKRTLRPVLSESGEKDIVAEFESQKEKYALYEFFNDVNCLIEIDEQPPNEINQHALNTALIASKLLNANITDIIEVMRKQVLDYSNTSGFQRTLLLARNGYFNLNGKKIRIQSICLEEDAARKVKEEKDYVIYRLDRLGTPLIEIATYPDINNPDEAKQAAETLGMILKSTNRFQSGIGTIRQDLNLSIKNGARVELKGVQDLKALPKIIENEVKRQLSILKQNKKVKEEVRRVLPDNTTEFMRPMPGSSRMYVETDHPLIHITPNMLKNLKLPELITEKVIKLEKKYNLDPKIAKELVDNKNFPELVKKFKNIPPKFIAHILVEIPKEIKKRFNLKTRSPEKILSHLNQNKINKDAVLELMVEEAKGKEIDIKKYKKIDIEDIKKEIEDYINKNKHLSFNALMGDLMKKYRGKVNSKEMIKLIKR